MSAVLERIEESAWRIDHLDWLESEAIHILREVAAECRNPALLFSGGKDSICLRAAEKAFRRNSVSLLHIDTGHNFPVDASASARGELGRTLSSARQYSMRRAGCGCAPKTRAATSISR